MSRLDLPAMPGVSVTHRPHAVEFAVPTVDGEPTAVRRLAAACVELSDEIDRTRLMVGRIIGDLATQWQGPGFDSALHPADHFDTNAAGAQDALLEVADRLNKFATALEQAAEQHSSWWHKAIVIGAVVAVTATAVTVTVSTGGTGAAAGAAGATEAIEAVAGMADATASAGDAAATLAGELSETTTSLGRITELVQLFRSQLVTAEINAGMTAGVDELLHNKIGWRDCAINAVTGFAAADAIQGLTPVIDEAFAELPSMAGWLAQHGAQGVVWGAATGASDVFDNGHVNGEDIGLGTATGSVGLLGREAHDLLSAAITGAGQTGTSWLESASNGDQSLPDMRSAFRQQDHHRKAEHQD